MPELDDLRPGPWLLTARVEAITRTYAQINYLQAVLRLELDQFLLETPGGHRKFCADQLALRLAESCSTMDRLLTDAQIFAEYPTVVGHVAAGRWTIRHADALIDELLSSTLTPAQREQVAELVAAREGVRTPYEIRRAARAAVLAIDPEAAEKKYQKIRDDRHVSSNENADGSATASVTGPKHLIGQLNAALDTMCLPRQPEDTRSLAQRRFDMLMDLVCGRAAPGQWTAYVMVRLDALESLANGAPAQAGIGGEIPGLGLITSTEAQQVLGLADVRRAVVDEHDRLISLDALLHTPDTADATGATVQEPVRLVSDAVEPAVEPSPDEQVQDQQPNAADRQWATQAQHDADHAQHQADLDADLAADTEAELDAQVDHLTTSLDQQLIALLGDRPLAFAAAAYPAPTRMVVELDPPPHRPDPGPAGPGHPGRPDRPDTPARPDPPPQDGPPEPDPSLSDQDWLEWELGPPFTEPRFGYRPPPPAPRTPTAPPRWTPAAAQRALTALTTRPPDRRSLDSSAYALPPRLARHVKARDITCTFPGCHLLAQRCQNDHVLAWPAGKSEEHNIRSECIHHHQAKHAVFTVTHLPHGGLRWTTLGGHHVDRLPRPFLRGW